ncbi:MAG: excinuclease ABC subunit UvrB [Candidatus Omnitrophica bacterium]|nr:excinuclease ABC subunit UvrB [Candidatus Omnitrophota bacterium]MBU1631100.1 excinuclease ABC subunit UvrB [Candidatus Omnitrophota bacterium]MBU1766733.1 excinuclease ABC subunit UvrB [Candidatus Omnitrophota bacterium]MBU1889216.1 excinuclease ABC subunit UvrB [Candidatus Omnitrophota bacterium]
MFNLISPYKPKGDQPKAIEKLTDGLKRGYKEQTLLGVTGSGKTFTIANVIANINKPTLVISHNKTLAAQLYSEFKQFFPNNAVEYFVSYYDYYQPEAYLPMKDLYIEKDSSINEDIDRLRLKATSSLFSRDDVIIVASVSCIYGLGSPEEWQNMALVLEKNKKYKREHILERLIQMQYERNDINFKRGTFRVRGDTLEVFPAYEETALKLEMWGDKIERMKEINHLTNHTVREINKIMLYPAKHFVASQDNLNTAIKTIKMELKTRLADLNKQHKLLEAQRLETRTNYDMEMLQELGHCQGIENYSRHLSLRKPGGKPYTLIDYFPKDFLLIIDESHVTVPQIRGMYNGDRARKETLVEYGFRLPSALDNRPLRFEEFEKIMNKTIFLSATPSPFELNRSKQVVEQIIRPTGLVDPKITIKPTEHQIDDLLERIRKRAEKHERILVTTLTKRMSEELAEYLSEKGVKVRYLHSEIETIERVEILSGLRKGDFDCLVGINLLREGLDLPEVSLVAILDADKEGLFRSETSLIQVMGRCARNVGGEVVMYADEITNSMKRAIYETVRRRKLQMDYNRKNNITPKTIKKEIVDLLKREIKTKTESLHLISLVREKGIRYTIEDESLIAELETEMLKSAKELEFEKAAIIRDEIKRMRETMKKKIHNP